MRRRRRRKKGERQAYLNKRIVRVEETDEGTLRLVLSCGHVRLIGKPVVKRPKYKAKVTKCYQCKAGIGRQVSVRKKKRKKT